MKRLACLVFLLGPTMAAMGEDWPQWMGPQRDNVWRESGLLEKFPADGPPVLWRAPVAGGYAGPAVVGDRVYVTDYVTSDNVKVANFERKEFTGIERVLCLDEATGKELWKHEYPVKYTLSYPAGPRCTPTVDENRVYTLGAEGHLICFDRESGEVLWSKEFQQDYDTKSALWGYASHPLIDGNKLICIVGRKGDHVVAFDKLTGEELWRANSVPEQGYSPPTIFEAGGLRQLVILSPDSVSSLDPETGDEYWSVPYEATSGSIIMSPVISDDYIYVGGYSNKNLLLKLGEGDVEPEVVFQDERDAGISPVNVQPIVVDGVLYGMDQSGELMAVELPSGERRWATSAPVGERPEGSGTAFIVKQADRYWLFNERGELVICRITPEGYDELDRAKVIEPTNVAFGRDVVWCAPAFAHGKMYVRNDDECICVDLRQ
ncbi:MAG: PQQ-binding-like beta-propeller repeat protein [Planctomycetota bacterium]